MKHIITLIAGALLAMNTFAQTIDIISLDKRGPDKIKIIIGEEVANCSWTLYDDVFLLETPPPQRHSADPNITIWEDDYSLCSFGTDNPRYIFLSNYIEGGVKVGDPLSKVETVDFSATRYGRNDKRNNCHRVNFYDGQEWYVIFGQTHQEIELLIENGIIKEIYLEWPDREEGFFPDNYDITNSMF